MMNMNDKLNNKIVTKSEKIDTNMTDLEKLNKCYGADIQPWFVNLRIGVIIGFRKNYLSIHECKLVTAEKYLDYLNKVDNKNIIQSDDPQAALLGVLVTKNDYKHSDWYVVQFEEYRDLVNKQESVV